MCARSARGLLNQDTRRCGAPTAGPRPARRPAGPPRRCGPITSATAYAAEHRLTQPARRSEPSASRYGETAVVRRDHLARGGARDRRASRPAPDRPHSVGEVRGRRGRGRPARAGSREPAATMHDRMRPARRRRGATGRPAPRASRASGPRWAEETGPVAAARAAGRSCADVVTGREQRRHHQRRLAPTPPATSRQRRRAQLDVRRRRAAYPMARPAAPVKSRATCVAGGEPGAVRDGHQAGSRRRPPAGSRA